MLAEIWPPSEPPTFRKITFMPVATPVWSGRTDSTITFTIEAKARPMPRPMMKVTT